MSIWETTTFDKIFGVELASEGSPLTMAAAVSSQEDSMLKIFICAIITDYLQRYKRKLH